MGQIRYRIEGGARLAGTAVVLAAELAKLGARIDLNGQTAVVHGPTPPTPTHRLPAYNLELDLPHTDQAAQQVLSLPVHPALSPADLSRLTDAVNQCPPRYAPR
jgi:dTDP-4-amino-4,6-dideoxygalactose transaminase